MNSLRDSKSLVLILDAMVKFFISLWLFDEYRNKTYGVASLKIKLVKSSASLVFCYYKNNQSPSNHVLDFKNRKAMAGC